MDVVVWATNGPRRANWEMLAHLEGETNACVRQGTAVLRCWLGLMHQKALA